MLITGVSSGIGNALVRRVAAEPGWTVIGTVRTVKPPSEYGLPDAAVLYSFEASDPNSSAMLATRVLAEHGCPDVIVNNAGYVLYGPVEETPPERIRDLYQVNVFSPVSLIQQFLPAMRERGSGTVVNVTSLGGRLVFPFFTSYNSTKHAMEGYSEGLWHELKPFGIRVKAVEPGYVATPIYKAMDERAEPMGPYAKFLSAMNRFSEGITNRSTPEQAAEETWRAITDTSDRLRYPIAAYARVMVRVRALVGSMAFMRFMNRQWLGK
jgi:NAD(P)-dependent dehydrogenase (short-subunit alcohol dehydrogenase family)